MKIKPLNNRILVDPMVETVTSTGIILPGKKEDKPSKGKVIEVSEGISNIKKDDIVIFNKYTAIEIEELGDKYLILKQEDLYGIISK